MLIVDVKINHKRIDTIYIHRLEPVSYSDDLEKEYEYEVLGFGENNTIKKRLDKNIKCVYGDYKLLLKRVLEELMEKD